jgi:hypothetical protein
MVAAMILALVAHGSPLAAQTVETGTQFPDVLVHWVESAHSPVFTAQGPGHWDAKIRERGWILRDLDGYHLWFTGYDGTRDGIKRLGYATSSDGLHWKRFPRNPLVRNRWIEDMMVVQRGGTYYMFSEGPANGHAEMLTSKNRIDWKWEGPLDIRLTDGKTAAEKPCGTPTVYIENGVGYLFYERHDLGVWLARSTDPKLRRWINVSDEPVLSPGPDAYDSEMIAIDQVIKYRGTYYAIFHGSGAGEPRTWNTDIARSRDLIHWEKYEGNPIVAGDKSSGVLVAEGSGFRLYTMHDRVDVYFSRKRPEQAGGNNTER